MWWDGNHPFAAAGIAFEMYSTVYYSKCLGFGHAVSLLLSLWWGLSSDSSPAAGVEQHAPLSAITLYALTFYQQDGAIIKKIIRDALLKSLSFC